MKNIKLCLLLLLSMMVAPASAYNLSAMTDYYTDDFDALSKHGVIRFLVVYDAVNYYFIDGYEDGLAVALAKKFKKHINETYLKDSDNKIDIQFIPVREDRIYKLLLKGVGDVAASFMIPTKKMTASVAYTDPYLYNLKEILVTGPHSKPVARINDLSGISVYIRKTSKSYETVKTINAILKNLDLPGINIVLVDEAMQDGELIKRVQQSEIPATIVDSSKVRLWKKLFKNVIYHENLPLTENLTMNWAVRPYNYHLQNELNKFLGIYNQNTPEGKKLIDSYLRGDPSSTRKFGQKENSHMLGLKIEDFEKFSKVFIKYGQEFDLDWHLMMCQAYKESSFNQNAKSGKGAVGILQVSPSMASNFLVKSTAELENIDGNTRAAAKYLRHIIDNYIKKDFYLDSTNQMAFALASYNAGPGRIRQYRKIAQKEGLDPNIWFKNVEKIAQAKGLTETVGYVSSIMKCHKAYIQSENAQKKKHKNQSNNK